VKRSTLESTEKIRVGEDGLGISGKVEKGTEEIGGKSFWEFLKENIIEWVMMSIGITLILIGVAQHFHWLENEADRGLVVRAGENSEGLAVDIAGAVVRPGVYQLSNDSRVNDLLVACGGLTQWVNQRFVERDLNRARLISDGEKIYIPYIGEEIAGAALSAGSGSKIDINKAAVGELESLSGIGFAYASAIIEYRQDKGSFSSIEEIKNVPGIGEKTFEKIKNSITIN